MKTKTLFLTLSVLLAILGQVVQGADKNPPEVIMHDYAEITEDLLKWWGNVELIWDKYRVYADYVEYDAQAEVVTAKGRVSMSSEDTVLSGEKLKLTLKDGTGEMYDTYGQIAPSVHYTAREWKQADKNTYRFRDLEFTSCAQCVPRWKIVCSKGKIKKDKYIEMKNVVLKIKNVPILFLPYMSYPIKDRASGFLFPTFGQSDLKGFYVQSSFYWDIRDNLDTTLGFDYMSRAGIGLSDEFRYLFRDMEGDLKVYFFKYRMEEAANQPGVLKNVFGKGTESDYYVYFKHSLRLDSLNMRIVANVDTQSDPAFLRLFDNNFFRYLSNRYSSEIYAQYNWSNVSVSLKASKNVTLYTFEGKEVTSEIKHLPLLAASLYQQKIWKLPGYFSLSSDYDIVGRKGVLYEADEQNYETDFTSQRINVNPSYSLTLFTLPWLSSTVSLQSKHSYYFKSRDPVSKGVVDEPLYLNYNMVGASLKGPVFSRVFEGKKSRFKHLIEPQIDFRYSSKVDDEDRRRLIPIDFFDRPPFSYVGFRLTTRLLSKSKEGNESPTEILSYAISQDYYLDPKEANFYRRIGEEYPEFSELNNRLRLRPGKDFSLDITLAYNYYLKMFNQAYVLLSYNPGKSILNGSLAYSTFRNPYKDDYYQNRSYFRGDIGLNAPGFPLKLNGAIDYDFTDRVFRFGSFIASYEYQCIHFNAEFRVFTNYNGELDHQYNFGISFGDIGMVKDFLGVSRW